MNKMKTKPSQLNKFLRIITSPVRALGKARDFYIKGITNYADKMNCGSYMAAPGPASVPGALPRSFSANTARHLREEDYRELLRTSSAQNSVISTNIGLDSHVTGPSNESRAMTNRSRSVAMGRIDEESPCCYFGDLDDIISVKNELKYPRSRSHSVMRKVY